MLHPYIQYAEWKSGKENMVRSTSPTEVHHIARKPDTHYSLYKDETDLSQLSIPDDVSEADSERKMMKRKILRY